MIAEKLTKLDAARRQLDEAIRMFFEKRDAVATHTVASAAAQVLADLGKVRGFAGWTRNPAMIKPGRWKEWRAAFTKFETFFKHADQDPNATCDFRPVTTIFTIVESIELLRVLTGKYTWPGLVFSLWFSVVHPKYLLESELKRLVSERSHLLPFDLSEDYSVMADLLNMQDAAPAAILDNLLI